jgi:hypothetical protein
MKRWVGVTRDPSSDVLADLIGRLGVAKSNARPGFIGLTQMGRIPWRPGKTRATGALEPKLQVHEVFLAEAKLRMNPRPRWHSIESFTPNGSELNIGGFSP